MDKQFEDKENYHHSWKCGTNRYMSINTHIKLKPSIIDDIESLLYSLINLAGIKLPWEGIKASNYQINNIILKLKESVDISSLCGEEYYFISKLFYYLNKIKRGENELNFEVIYEIIEEEKKISKFDKIEYDSDFCFIELLKN